MLDIHSRTNRKSDGPISIVTSPFMGGYFRQKVQTPSLVLAQATLFWFYPKFSKPDQTALLSAVLESNNSG